MTRPHADDPFSRGGTRPAGRVLAAKRRVAHLAAEGRAAAEIAAIEGVEAGQVEELLADAGFAPLLRAYKALDASPSAEQRAKLVAIALHLIDEAIGLGHVRVGFFVVREMLHGRCAAETVADKLIAQRAKAAEPPPAERAPEASASPAARPRLPAHPADRMAQRGCRDLMRAVLAEFRVRAEAVARSAARDAIAAVRHAPQPSPTGWRRRLATRLLTTTAAPIQLGACPPKLAQAP